MKTALTVLTVADLIFILLLGISGSASGISSELLYYGAFLLPLLICLPYLNREKDGEGTRLSLSINRRDIYPFSLLVFPAIAVIVLLALLTSVLMNAFGMNNEATITEALPLALLLHALLPSVLEELVFRYMPIKLLSPYSKRYAIIFSALFFALCHANLFQIPYAFAAGLIFAIIDISFESILPSFIIHFINNTLSVVTMIYPSSAQAAYITLGALTVGSLVLIFFQRKRYQNVRQLFSRGVDEQLSLAPLGLLLVSLIIAITSLT